MQSEKICSFSIEHVNFIKNITSFLNTPTHNINFLNMYWYNERKHFDLLMERAKRKLQLTSRGSKIAEGSLLGVVMNQPGELFSPMLKPLVNIANIVYRCDPGQLGFSERKAFIVSNLFNMLDHIKEDKITILPLWAYWLVKYILIYKSIN